MKKQIKTLVQEILTAIYNDCYESWETEIIGEVEVRFASVKYIVWAYHPTDSNYASTYRLQSAYISDLVNENCIPLTNVMNAVNEALNELDNVKLEP